LKKGFQGYSEEKVARDVDLGLGNAWVFGTQYFLGPSCAVHLVSEFDPENKLSKLD
jgi:hypothetical protein